LLREVGTSGTIVRSVIAALSAVTFFGVVALTFMMLMYALEGRGSRFVLAFAGGCVLSSVYGFLSGAWPFGVVEAVWAGIALRRFARLAEGRRQ
jgi:hypothetical protein